VNARTWRKGLVILLGVLVALLLTWLLTVGTYGPWRWHEVARQQVGPMSAPGEMLDLSQGPFVSTAPFTLSGRPVRITLAQAPSSGGQGFVTLALGEADARPRRGTGTGIAPGESRTFTTAGGASGRYRLFVNSSGAVTITVGESRDRPLLVGLVFVALIAAIVVWVVLGWRHARTWASAFVHGSGAHDAADPTSTAHPSPDDDAGWP
jgi:hypothetical protein